MQIQVDEISVIGAVVGAAAGIVLTILVGVWRLMEALNKSVAAQLARSDAGLEQRQRTHQLFLEAHVQSEENTVRALRQEFLETRDQYVTDDGLNRKLAPIHAEISQIRRIVDARARSGADPVSGRPERRGAPDGER